MTNQECIKLIDEKLAVADMEREEFKKYELEKYGVAPSHEGSIYASKLGILEGVLTVLKIELERRERNNARNKNNI